MSNRRNYGNNSGGGGGGGGNYGGGGGGGGRYQQIGGGGGGSVNPWQSGSSPGRGIPPLIQQNLLSQLTSPDSQLALATKLLSSILPGVGALGGAPPSLLNMGGGGGGGGGNGNYGGPGRFMGGGGGGGNFMPNSRFRRDDRRQGGGPINNYNDNKNRQRPQNDRNKDRDRRTDKGRYDGPKPKPKDETTSAAKASPEVKIEKPKKVEETTEMEKDVKEESDEPLEAYIGIPSKLFHCHVCGKSMWNDVSFDTHVKGRNHLQKMRELDESYQVQTNLMREIAAVSLKLEEVRRGKRRPYPDQYCKMCDLHFNGMTMFAHRSTEEHQNLKRFIHPTCNLCVTDFKARLEYDEHTLTPEHLQREAKLQARKELYEKDPKYVALRQEEAKFRFTVEEMSLLNVTAPQFSEEDKKAITEEDLNLPPFDQDAEQPVGIDIIKPVSGFLCEVCKVFVLSKETADLHARTHRHYEVFVHRILERLNKSRREKDSDDKRKNPVKEDSDAAAAKRVKMEADGEEEDEEKAKDHAEVKEEAEDGQANGSPTTPAAMEGVESEKESPTLSESSTPATPRRATARRARGRGRK